MSNHTLAPRREAGMHAVPREDHELRAAPRAGAASMVRPGRLRRLTRRLAALVADDGMHERFVAQRRRDEDLIRRVGCRRHL
jgi:hypothetical protein